jgi:hypothetical protein
MCEPFPPDVTFLEIAPPCLGKNTSTPWRESIRVGVIRSEEKYLALTNEMAGRMSVMRKASLLALLFTLPAAIFGACSADPKTTTGSSSSSGTAGSAGNETGGSAGAAGGNAGGAGPSSSSSNGSSGSAGNAGNGGAGTGGAGTGGASNGGAGGNSSGSAGSAGSGGGASSGGPADAGPDVSFSYDADVGDGSVTEDSACAAEAVAAQKRPVDIIWAVDTSGSMSQEIAQIKANINSQFADILGASGLDYQVIMIAAKGTGTFQVCVAPPLGGFNCGANQPLFRAINQTIGSTNSLSLLLSTYDNANLALRWQQYLRYDAVKVFVEVTDDNSSLSGMSFDTQLLAKMPTGMFGDATKRNYIFHSIIGVTEGNPAVKCPSAVNIGAQYQVLSNLTGGGMYPVCAADYSPIFNAIATGIAAGLACEFTMPTSSQGTVDPNNVSMTFTPSNGMGETLTRVNDVSQCAAGNEWYYDNNMAPTKLILCPNACTTVKADPAGKINILLGCVTG